MVDMEWIFVVCFKLWFFKPGFNCFPDASTLQQRFSLFLAVSLGKKEKIAIMIGVDLFSDEDQESLLELKTQRIDRG